MKSFLTSLLLGGAAGAQFDFTGYSVVDATIATSDLWALDELIRSSGLEVWDASPGPNNTTNLDLLVPPRVPKMAQATFLDWSVRVPNYEAVVAEERDRLSSIPLWNASQPFDVFFNDFRRLAEYNTFLDRMIRDYPTLATGFNLGTTIQGRVIRGISVRSAGSNKRSIYIQGCVHAREWLASSGTMYFIYSLLSQYATNSRIRAAVDKIDFHIVPIVNQDGYEFTWATNRNWRKNRRANGGTSFGVDINRNWGPTSTWCTSGSSRDPNSDTYCGTAAFSEPETAASGRFTDGLRGRLCTGVDMHTYGNLILWPWQYTYDRLPATPYAMMQRIGLNQQNAIRAVNGVTYRSQQGSDLYPHSGGMIDYLWTTQSIPAFTYEGRGSAFVIAPSNIVPAGEECLAGILSLVDEC
jgi:murein tripeptide amidase MpaA